MHVRRASLRYVVDTQGCSRASAGTDATPGAAATAAHSAAPMPKAPPWMRMARPRPVSATGSSRWPRRASERAADRPGGGQASCRAPDGGKDQEHDEVGSESAWTGLREHRHVDADVVAAVCEG